MPRCASAASVRSSAENGSPEKMVAADCAAPGRFSGSEAFLYEAACVRAGLRFDGALDNCEGLTVLLHAMDDSKALSAAGREFSWDVLINTVSARLFTLS